MRNWLSTVGIFVMFLDLTLAGLFQGYSWAALQVWEDSLRLRLVKPYGPWDRHRLPNCSIHALTLAAASLRDRPDKMTIVYSRGFTCSLAKQWRSAPTICYPFSCLRRVDSSVS